MPCVTPPRSCGEAFSHSHKLKLGLPLLPLLPQGYEGWWLPHTLYLIVYLSYFDLGFHNLCAT